jgi:hypothetical protein
MLRQELGEARRLVDLLGARHVTVDLLKRNDVGAANRLGNAREIEPAVLTEGVLGVIGHEIHGRPFVEISRSRPHREASRTGEPSPAAQLAARKNGDRPIC